MVAGFPGNPSCPSGQPDHPPWALRTTGTVFFDAKNLPCDARSWHRKTPCPCPLLTRVLHARVCRLLRFVNDDALATQEPNGSYCYIGGANLRRRGAAEGFGCGPKKAKQGPLVHDFAHYYNESELHAANAQSARYAKLLARNTAAQVQLASI
eukprot:1189602-Prorocentrum_minimum.AAC.1